MNKVETFSTKNTLLNSRNYGIDLLRIVSMLMVVIVHIPGAFEGWNNTETNSFTYLIFWGLDAFVVCAVNIFAIISGYVYCNKGFKLKRLLELWLQVEFFSVLTEVFNIAVNKRFSWISLLKSFFPIINEKYWYFTAYFFLLLLMPMFNKFINGLNSKQFLITLAVLLFCFSIAAIHFDPWNAGTGYNWIWIAVLYFVGAYFKRFGLLPCKKIWLLTGYLVSGLFIIFSKFVINILIERFSLPSGYSNFFFVYNSVFVIAEAVFLFNLFAKSEFKNRKVVKLISIVSPLSFGVYLCHNDFIISRCIIYNFEMSPILYLPLSVITAVLVYAICAIVDEIRIYLFKFLKIGKLFEKIQFKIESFIKK